MPDWTVSREEANTRLVNFIRDKLEGVYPARALKRAIESNLCQVNGAVERFASRPLKVGDRVSFKMEEPQPKAAQTQWKVLYIDEGLLIADKPSGVAVDAEEALAPLVAEHGELFLVHRLDRETSGVLLLARTKQMQSLLEALFRSQEVEKDYLAIVDGCPPEKKGEVKNRLGKLHTYQGQAIFGAVTAKQEGRSAHTVWRVLKVGQGASLVACQPKTGRTHQLRVHLKEMGHPILGDYQYARRFACPYRPRRCLLHASIISFVHPLTEKKVRIRAPLPEDFQEALKALQIRFGKGE